MEQKFIQANITVLLYLIVLYYLKNAAISFVEFPKKMFDYVKVYYIFLIFITILGFFKRLFILIRMLVIKWIQELLFVLFLGQGNIRMSDTKDIICKKRSKSLTRWKSLQETTYPKKTPRQLYSIEHTIEDWKKLVERKNWRKKCDLQKCNTSESKNPNFLISGTFFCKEENNVANKKKKMEDVEFGKLKDIDNLKVLDVKKTKKETEKEETKKETEKEETKKETEKEETKKEVVNKQGADGIKHIEKRNSEIVGIVFPNKITTEKKDLHILRDKLQEEIRNYKYNSTCENNESEIIDTSTFQNIKEEIRHRSMCLEKCGCDLAFHYDNRILSNRNDNISEELEDIGKSGKNILAAKCLINEEIQKELELVKNKSNSNSVITATTNKECMDKMREVMRESNKNENIEISARLTKPLKSILKKNTSNNNSNGGSGIREEKEKKNKKFLRFNNEVETYYFEKSSSEEYPFVRDSKQMLWNIYGSYKISSADFFDYFNIKNSFKVAIHDFLNPIHAYKNKLIKRF